LNLKAVLGYFVLHRKEIVIRRTRFDLAKAEARAHILEGLKIALDHLDEVVALIRNSASPAVARERLMAPTRFPKFRPRPFWTCACSA